jgi:hypothetical protein
MYRRKGFESRDEKWGGRRIIGYWADAQFGVFLVRVGPAHQHAGEQAGG